MIRLLLLAPFTAQLPLDNPLMQMQYLRLLAIRKLILIMALMLCNAYN